jgi:hypothetical protein
MAPTVAKNGATVTMSSGKSFDRQLALDLRADASLTGLSLARWRVLLADASLLLARQRVIDTGMPLLL